MDHRILKKRKKIIKKIGSRDNKKIQNESAMKGACAGDLSKRS